MTIKPFQPATPERMVQMEVSVRERQMIKNLRKYPFGKITVHKAENLIVRLEAIESVLISEGENEQT